MKKIYRNILLTSLLILGLIYHNEIVEFLSILFRIIVVMIYLLFR